MSNVVKFTGKKPEPPKGAHFAGRPLRESFPNFIVEHCPARDQARLAAESRIISDDQPDGAA